VSARASPPLVLGLSSALLVVGCIRAPSPLTPERRGSIGLPHRGSLSSPASLPDRGYGLARLRKDERRFGTPRLIRAIERAAHEVAKSRPGSVLVVGDLSVRQGGRLPPHLSHRSGRDADLLLYVETPGGAMVTSPGFIHFGADGLAWDPKGERYLRFDVAREWTLIKTLVEDDEARVQWVFLNHVLIPMVIEWAMAKGEPVETIHRAEQVLLEPHPGGAHDDHTHIRVACDAEEVAEGCEPNGPLRAWFPNDVSDDDPAPSDDELARAITGPMSSR
jgi:penicillin-insensitive murein endopeptidase